LKENHQQARSKVAQLEKELPEKLQAVISPSEIPGLKVHICTLVAPDSPPDNWMDVYVHSKLMIVDDVFTTLGSANINTRSMQVDSELNICVEDPAVSRPLREHLFGVHTGGRVTGGEMSKVYREWQNIIGLNRNARANNYQSEVTIEPSPPIASLVEFMQESPIKKNWD
jgi:phosphatidylserine/phosphatidylglycerophosphate/cardiolipin synthase-like enzyme